MSDFANLLFPPTEKSSTTVETSPEPQESPVEAQEESKSEPQSEPKPDLEAAKQAYLNQLHQDLADAQGDRRIEDIPCNDDEPYYLILKRLRAFIHESKGN